MNLILVLALAVACLLLVTVHGMDNAKDVSITQYPFMAVVAYGPILVGNGVILAPRWILTAASTLLGPGESLYEAVVAGDYMSNGKWYELVRVWRHPEYAGYEYNVALLQLRKALVYSPRIQPIGIIRSNPSTMDPVKVLSYGKQKFGNSHLQESEYLLESDIHCVNTLSEPYSKDAVRSGHAYCILWYPGPDKLLWYNDAGAPAIANNEVVGIFSIGDFKEELPFDFGATRLGHPEIRDWIDNKIKT